MDKMELLEKATKERCPNFSSEEVSKLKALVEKYADILLNKATDATSAKQKSDTWAEIEKEFNATGSIFRTSKQLKLKLENMKKFARKEAARERQQLIKTGGGPSTYTPDTVTEWVRSVVPSVSIDGEEPLYDDDTYGINKPIIVPPTLEPGIGTEEKIITIHEEFIMQDATLEANDEQPTGNQPLDKKLLKPTLKRSLFDSSTPTSMLRNPASTPLKRLREKPGENITPLQLRRKFNDLTNKKSEWAEARKAALDTARELQLEEHKMKLKHLQEEHSQKLKFNEERHMAELDLLQIKKEKIVLEMELMKQQLNK